jgi:hypothetical protein
MTGRYRTLAGSWMATWAFAPRRGLPSRNQTRAWASRTYSLAMPVVELLFAVPLGILEVFEGRHPAGVVLAERQWARRRLGLFACKDDDPNGPLGQAGGCFQELDLALLVIAFEEGDHGKNLLERLLNKAARAASVC